MDEFEKELSQLSEEEQRAILSLVNNGSIGYSDWDDLYKQFKTSYKGKFDTWEELGKCLYSLFEDENNRLKEFLNYEKYALSIMKNDPAICFFDYEFLFFLP